MPAYLIPHALTHCVQEKNRYLHFYTWVFFGLLNHPYQRRRKSPPTPSHFPAGFRRQHPKSYSNSIIIFHFRLLPPSLLQNSPFIVVVQYAWYMLCGEIYMSCAFFRVLRFWCFCDLVSDSVRNIMSGLCCLIPPNCPGAGIHSSSCQKALPSLQLPPFASKQDKARLNRSSTGQTKTMLARHL